MKNSILTLLCVFGISATSHAVVDDFNSILDENTKIQKELTDTLQQQLATKDLGKATKPDFRKVGEEVVGRSAENIAVETSGLEDSRSNSELKKHNLKFEKTNFKRLSEELKDAR